MMRKEMYHGETTSNPASLSQLQKQLPSTAGQTRRVSNEAKAKSIKPMKIEKSESSEKKKKKSKKKKSKKKKHKKSVTTKITEGEMDASFAAFAPENFLPDPSTQCFLATGGESKNSATDDAWADFGSQTPAMTSSSKSDVLSKKHGLPGSCTSLTKDSSSKISDNGESRRSQDSGQIRNVDGGMLKSYLAENGQDEKMAIATALAFESFLKEQQLKLAHEESVTGGALSVSQDETASRDSSRETIDDDDYNDSDSEDESIFLHETNNTAPLPTQQSSRDFSDVSTLGMNDVADPDFDSLSFGGSWADGTWVHGPPSTAPSSVSDGQNDFGRVYRNPSFQSPIAGVATGMNNRRLPNRVAAAATSTQRFQDPIYGGRVQVSHRNNGERSYNEQMAALTIDERGCVNALKAKWTKSSRYPLPNVMYLKFARCSLPRPFTFKTAYNNMKKYDYRYMGLSILNMEEQIRRKILFPVEGLRSIEGHDMFYMMPARYFPKKMSVSSVINNLIYAIDCLMEKECAQRDGIGFVANMTDWKMTNFQVSYCYKFMMGLQGKKTPVRVQYFLIVNPPSWFGSIWSIMKPMLAEDFRRKVHMIPFEEMPQYLAPGFEDFLPEEMYSGRNPTDQIIEDFIESRKQVEGARLLSSPSVTSQHTY